MTTTPHTIPKAFVWKRLHSLTGLWLVAFLIIHLLTNSQAALWIGDDGHGFIKSVNDIRDLPYLRVIEIVLLGIPFMIHIIWGIKALHTAKYNSFQTDGAKPDLSIYPRNQAYTWQRITSWILLVLITAHVVQMRFMEYPTSAQKGSERFYMVRLNSDPGLYTLAERLKVELYNQQMVNETRQLIPAIQHSDDTVTNDLVKQSEQQKVNWLAALTKRPIDQNQVIAVAKNFGTAELLMVRDTFKIPVMLFLYTVLVISACFHAFNGLWTFLITWGITLSPKSQNSSKHLAIFLMTLIAFLGLAAIWGSYWINLKQ